MSGGHRGLTVPVATPALRGGRRDLTLPLAALAVAAVTAASPLAFGYYGFTAWAPLGLGALALLAMLLFAPAAKLTVNGRVAVAGGGLLVALSFASLLWAESRESAWTAANLITLYAVVLAIGLVAIRNRATAWSVMVVLGLPALLSALVLAGELVSGGAGALLDGRLNAPMGYINATAALLTMGIWPWLALAETAGRRRPQGAVIAQAAALGAAAREATALWAAAREAAALGAAALIGSVAVLTQTRAILLAAGLAAALGLIGAPARKRRAINMLIVVAAVAAGSPWTLRVYSSTAPAHLTAPTAHVLTAAGLAVLGSGLLAALLAGAAHALRGVTSFSLPRPFPPRAPRRRRAGPVAVALAALVLAGGGLALHAQIAARWHAFTTSHDALSAGDRFLALGGGYRYDIWRIAVDEFLDEPLGGVGAGNYADQEYQRRRLLEHVSTPHSLELQMLAELGLGGGLGLGLFLVATLAAGLGPRRETLASGDPALRFAALGVFCAWLGATSVDFIYSFPGLTGMALLAAAVLLVPAPPGELAARSPRASAYHGRRTLALGLMALALPAAGLGRQYAAALYSDTGQALAARHPARALGALRTAAALDPWSLQTQYAIATAYAREDDYGGARAALLRAARLEPENFVPPALLGDIAMRAGLPRVAHAEYRRALALDPLEPALRRALRRSEAALKRGGGPAGPPPP